MARASSVFFAETSLRILVRSESSSSRITLLRAARTLLCRRAFSACFKFGITEEMYGGRISERRRGVKVQKGIEGLEGLKDRGN